MMHGRAILLSGGFFRDSFESAMSDFTLRIRSSKDYARQKQADDTLVNHVLGVSGAEVLRADIKPHGRVLADGRVFAWEERTLGKQYSWQRTNARTMSQVEGFGSF